MIDAMEKIEQDYETLRGALPKAEYQELDNDVLGQLLRTFNDPALRRADGDVFGRIYEYFLTQFADQKAHDGGEFFTPVALVQTIVNVIEPDHGRVLDPACGSGGMFVQSAHFIERMHLDPTERATFFGMEKNPTTIRLANMNLAVHGLEGNIHKAITYYEDPHELLGKCDFVMANPPFNVDEVDAEKVKERPAPALCPSWREQEGQGLQRQLPLDLLLRQLPEQRWPGRVRHVLAGVVGGRRGSEGAPEVDRGGPPGRDDGDPLRFLLHAHGAVRAVVPRQGQAR